MAAVPNTTALCEDKASQESNSRRDSVLAHPPRFTWTPLSNARKEIRVCRIEAGPEGSPIRMRLRTVDLEKSANEYTCLSYAWVDEEQSETVLVNNSYCPVTRNLHLQLSRLRALGHVQDLWVDSISIDQDTTTERSIQVALMGMIFSNASQVFLAVDEGGLLLRPSVLQEGLQDLSLGSHLRGFECLAFNQSPTKSVAADQLCRILNASFWTRCFTVQETVLAKKAIIVGEWGLIPFSSFVKASEAYNEHRQDKCCASFIDALPRNIQSSYYQVGNQSGETPTMISENDGATVA
jgi:hypothetical protein